jgi:hypothetical protein
MDAWLRASSDDERSETIERVSALVEKLPKEVLIGALQAMRAQRASLGYGAEIERILSERLVHIATANDDAELARMLMDADAGVVVLTGDAGIALSELATSRRGLNVVAGRTVGLLLPTGSAGLREEAASVLRGFMWAFGMPRGAGGPPPLAVDDGRAAPPQPCAPPGDAPGADDRMADDGARFATRSDSGPDDRTDASLDELAGEGASVIVAGLDPQTAARALRWSEQHGVVVATLASPDEAPAPASFGFQAGEPRARVIGVLDHAAPALGGDDVALVVDASEAALAGRVEARDPARADGGARSLLAPVSCDVTASRAGESRFPLAEWDHWKTAAWLVSGSPACGEDLVHDLGMARTRGVVAMTLEASAMPVHVAGLRVLAAQAGVVPAPTRGDPRAEAVRGLGAASGPVDWWTALGRDVATLARIAVRSLPPDDASDPRVVRERRTQARDALASARARLWTTESTGWSTERTLPRAVCAVEVPAR